MKVSRYMSADAWRLVMFVEHGKGKFDVYTLRLGSPLFGPGLKQRDLLGARLDLVVFPGGPSIEKGLYRRFYLLWEKGQGPVQVLHSDEETAG